MSCAKKYSIADCEYGTTHDSFQYIKDGNKLETLKNYPVNVNDKNCHFNGQGLAGLSNIYSVPVDPAMVK